MQISTKAYKFDNSLYDWSTLSSGLTVKQLKQAILTCMVQYDQLLEYGTFHMLPPLQTSGGKFELVSVDLVVYSQTAWDMSTQRYWIRTKPIEKVESTLIFCFGSMFYGAALDVLKSLLGDYTTNDGTKYVDVLSNMFPTAGSSYSLTTSWTSVTGDSKYIYAQVSQENAVNSLAYQPLKVETQRSSVESFQPDAYTVKGARHTTAGLNGARFDPTGGAQYFAVPDVWGTVRGLENAATVIDRYKASLSSDGSHDAGVDPTVVQQLRTDLDNEIASRSSADTQIQQAITDETSNREAAVQQEASAREAADAALREAIAAIEPGQGTSGVTVQQLEDEAASRLAADRALRAAIDSMSVFGNTVRQVVEQSTTMDAYIPRP